ncbi:hypothetical protein ACUY4Q_000772 [Phytobacter sp. AG2a]
MVIYIFSFLPIKFFMMVSLFFDSVFTEVVLQCFLNNFLFLIDI